MKEPIYYIIREECDYLQLMDGTSKKLDPPVPYYRIACGDRDIVEIWTHTTTLKALYPPHTQYSNMYMATSTNWLIAYWLLCDAFDKATANKWTDAIRERIFYGAAGSAYTKAQLFAFILDARQVQV